MRTFLPKETTLICDEGWSVLEIRKYHLVQGNAWAVVRTPSGTKTRHFSMYRSCTASNGWSLSNLKTLRKLHMRYFLNKAIPRVTRDTWLLCVGIQSPSFLTYWDGWCPDAREGLIFEKGSEDYQALTFISMVFIVTLFNMYYAKSSS